MEVTDYVENNIVPGILTPRNALFLLTHFPGTMRSGPAVFTKADRGFFQRVFVPCGLC